MTSVKLTATILAAILAGALVAACAASRRSGPPASPLIGGVAPATYSSSLVALGPSVDANHQRARGMGLVHAPELQAALQAILDRLAAEAPVQGIAPRVYVRAVENWGAMSTADANLFVNLETVRRVESEDEMAAVLAHELSHVVLGHHDSEVLEAFQERTVQLSLLALAASGMAGAGTGAIEAVTKAVYAGATSLKATQAVVSPAWRRDQEEDADFLAADLVARAGWDPEALVGVLAKQQDAEGRKADETSFFDDLRSVSLQSVSARGIDQKKLSEGVTSLLKDFVQRTALELARSHPDTGLRRAEATAYVTLHYPPATRPAPADVPWVDVVEAPSTRPILENYMAAREAETLLDGGDRRAAEQRARSGASGPTRDHAKPVLTLAAVQESSGRRRDAASSVGLAIDAPEPSFAVHREAARLATEGGDPNAAVAFLEQGWRSLDRPPDAIPPLIRAYKKAGRDQEASLLGAECALRYPKYHLAGLCSTEERHAALR